MAARKSRGAPQHHKHHQELALRRSTSPRAADDRRAASTVVPPTPSDVLQLDGDVRRMVRSMVGSLETVVGSLHGIVGSLRQLVSQIDAVTEKIDKCCGGGGSDNRASPRQARRGRHLPSTATLAVTTTTTTTAAATITTTSSNRSSLRASTASVRVQTPHVPPRSDVAELCLGARVAKHRSQDWSRRRPAVRPGNSDWSSSSPCEESYATLNCSTSMIGGCSYVTGRNFFGQLQLPVPLRSAAVVVSRRSSFQADGLGGEEPQPASLNPLPWLLPSSEWSTEPVSLPVASCHRKHCISADRQRCASGEPSELGLNPETSPYVWSSPNRLKDFPPYPSHRHVATMYAQTRDSGEEDEGEGLTDADIQHWQLMMETKCGSVGSLTPQMDWSYLGLTDAAASQESDLPGDMVQGEGFSYLPDGLLVDLPCPKRQLYDLGDCASLQRLSQRRLSERSEQSTRAPSDWGSSECSSIKSSDDEDDSRTHSPSCSPYLRHKVYQTRSRHCGTVSPLVQRRNGQNQRTSVFVTRSKFVVSQAATCGATAVPPAVAVAAAAAPAAYCGIYESAMEAELEQLSEEELDASDFSDVEADAGSDFTNRSSLTSGEAEEGLLYDRSVNTWKSYTMTHIDSDDALSESASDVNENFLDVAYAKPGFDDVKSKFSDIHLPALAY